MKTLILFLLISTPCLAYDMQETNRIVFDDGCIVENEIIKEGFDTPRVINPGQCPDKEFVKHLNCFDKLIIPVEYRPKECRS